MRFPRPPWGVRGPRQTSGLIGQRWKHREVLASRLVLITADTKQNPTHPPPPGTPEKKGGRERVWDTHTRTVRNHYANHDQPTPHTNTHARARALVACGIGKVGHKVCGGHSTGETPSNIPNLEATPGNANGPAIDRSWESRTPPQHNHTKTTRPPPPLPARRPGWGAPAYPHTPHAHPEHTHTRTHARERAR